jgi:hypothetical protein
VNSVRQDDQQTTKVATTVTSAGGAPPASAASHDDDEPAVAPPPRATTDRRPRRGAVSAEVYNEDDAANYVKTVCDRNTRGTNGFGFYLVEMLRIGNDRLCSMMAADVC